MPVSIELFSDEPILVATFTEPFKPREDLEKVAQHMVKILEDVPDILWRIDDTTFVEMTFTKLVEAMSAATRSKTGTVTDPRVELILVGTSETMKTAAKSMEQRQYGEVKVPLFTSRDDALAYVRGQIER